MKKSVLILLISMFFWITGCSSASSLTTMGNEIKAFDFDIPTGNISVSKNCPTGSSPFTGEDCETITIAIPESIESFIQSLNQIKYRPSHSILDIWGYKYVIEFDNTVIYVVTDQYFYFYDVLYEPTFGDFRFLDELGW